jgi:AraC-like DNA-binding protein
MTDALVAAVETFTRCQTGDSPFATAIEGLTVLRWYDGRHPSHIVHKPALCIVVRGAKWTTFGQTRLEYRTGEAMVVTVDMPGFSQIIDIDPGKPYLSVIIELDPTTMQEVLAQLEEAPVADCEARAGTFVIDCSGPLADCALRAVRLLETPAAIPLLYPAILREICYWLLTGPHGGEVATIALATTRAPGVIDAIHALRDRFVEPIQIAELAAVSHLSPSAFHRQFKVLTSMTPLQYQKQLRLVEARRLMLSDAVNVERAAYRTGYASPSQFSRDYARMFGTPPRRDIASIRSIV